MNRRLSLGAVLGAVVIAVGLSSGDGPAITAGAAALAVDDAAGAVRALSPPPDSSPSANRLMDLGVAHHRQGDLPRALAAWRNAWELAPRDPDLAHNVALARASLEGEATPAPAARPWLGLITADELGLIALIALVAATVPLWRARRDPTAVARPALVWFGAAALAALAADAAQVERGIVVTLTPAALRALPDPSEPDRAVIPAGSELRVLARRGDFVRVADGEARDGWILASSVTAGEAAPDVVVPPEG